MDRRRQKTRQAIFSAFEDLLTCKRYEQITVQDLIDRADIGRSTFYAHFETKDDLLRATCQELFDHVFESHPHAEDTHDFSKEQETLHGMLTHILYHLKDDHRRYARIFACESADLFWRFFRESFLQIAEHYEVAGTEAAHSVPQDFYLNYYCSAFIEAVKWWFRNDLTATPEELASYFETLTG